MQKVTWQESRWLSSQLAVGYAACSAGTSNFSPLNLVNAKDRLSDRDDLVRDKPCQCEIKSPSWHVLLVFQLVVDIQKPDAENLREVGVALRKIGGSSGLDAVSSGGISHVSPKPT